MWRVDLARRGVWVGRPQKRPGEGTQATLQCNGMGRTALVISRTSRFIRSSRGNGI